MNAKRETAIPRSNEGGSGAGRLAALVVGVGALLAAGQARTLAADACSTDQQAYAKSDVRFCYPAAWTVTTDALDRRDPRFVRVEIVAPARDQVINVRYRIADDKVISDSNALMDFSRQYCRDALDRGDIPSPAPSSSALYVQSFVRRGLSDRSECIGSTISLPPPPDLYSWKQYLSPRLAHVEYAHMSTRPRAPGFLSEIGGGEVEGYLRSLSAWNLIVNTFSFPSIGPASKPSLSGRWQQQGHGLLMENGRFTEYYFGAAYTPFPERHGTYFVRGDRLGFSYDGTGSLKGHLPSDCPYTINRDTLTICGESYARRAR